MQTHYITLHFQTVSRKLKEIPRPVKAKVHSRIGPRKKKPNAKLTTQFHLVPMLRKLGATPTSTPYVFKVRYLSKHRGTFTLLFSLSPRFSKYCCSACLYFCIARPDSKMPLWQRMKNIRTSLKGVALKYNPQDLSARQGFRAPVAAGVRSRVKHNGTTPF